MCKKCCIEDKVVELFNDPAFMFIGKKNSVDYKNKALEISCKLPSGKSPLSNPFEEIEEYEDYIRNKLENDGELRQEVRNLRFKTLGCSCHYNSSKKSKDIVCHGQILAKIADEYHKLSVYSTTLSGDKFAFCFNPPIHLGKRIKNNDRVMYRYRCFSNVTLPSHCTFMSVTIHGRQVIDKVRVDQVLEEAKIGVAEYEDGEVSLSIPVTGIQERDGKVSLREVVFHVELPRETKVVHLKREGGKIVQDCDVYIGRAMNRGGWNLKKSKWANPFTVKDCGSVEEAVKKYKKYILGNEELLSQLEELRGKTLGCWCAPGPCHGDILVELLK